jgi:hypothetical protein
LLDSLQWSLFLEFLNIIQIGIFLENQFYDNIFYYLVAILIEKEPEKLIEKNIGFAPYLK